MKTKNLVLAALLAGLSMLIVMIIPSIVPPPFTVTIGSHVPTMIAMFINPVVAGGTVLGSTLIFATKYPPVVPLRSATHIVFALLGTLILKKKGFKPFWIFIAWISTLVVHVTLELIVISLFMGVDLNFSFAGAEAFGSAAFLFGGLAFMIHHTIDFVIALAIASPLKNAKLL